MTTQESFVQTGPRGPTSFVGPDAVLLFQAIALAYGLKFWANTGIKPHRSWTSRRAVLAHVTRTYTRKPYLNNKDGMLRAAADLQIWIDAMRAAIPVVRA